MVPADSRGRSGRTDTHTRPHTPNTRGGSRRSPPHRARSLSPLSRSRVGGPPLAQHVRAARPRAGLVGVDSHVHLVLPELLEICARVPPFVGASVTGPAGQATLRALIEDGAWDADENEALEAVARVGAYYRARRRAPLPRRHVRTHSPHPHTTHKNPHTARSPPVAKSAKSAKLPQTASAFVVLCGPPAANLVFSRCNVGGGHAGNGD